MSRLPFALAMLLVTGSVRAADVVDASTLQGKVLLGYQGWFNCEGDGANLRYLEESLDNAMERFYEGLATDLCGNALPFQ